MRSTVERWGDRLLSLAVPKVTAFAGCTLLGYGCTCRPCGCTTRYGARCYKYNCNGRIVYDCWTGCGGCCVTC